MLQKTTKPLPYRQLFAICVCRFAEPICFTVIFPFVVQMIRDFHIADEKGVGYYVGLITSCFALAQLLTGIHWGILSDRIGRRPVILQGLVGTISSILLFGLSKSFIWALLSRSLCGLLNGNIGVLKSMVSELTMDYLPHQRAQAFSLLPLMYGLGSIIGPMLGGFLSHPVSNYPNVFSNLGIISDFLTNYPYFLPCFISASICTLGLIFGIFFLEETHVVHNENAMKGDEEEELLTNDSFNNEQHYSTFKTNSNTGTVKIQHSPTPTVHDKPTSPTLKEALTPSVLSICVTYAFFALQAIFMDELFPLYTASSRDSGGLGFTPNEIGVALSYAGVVTLIGQIFVLPTLTKRFGLLRLLQIVLSILIFLYLSQGIIRILYFVPDFHGETNTKLWVWVGLLISLTIKTIGHTICFTGCTILVNNACPSVDKLGAVNGFSQCCASAMRSIGPAICGTIWSASLSLTFLPYQLRINTTFILLAAIGALTFSLSKRLDPNDYETAHAREEVVHIYEEEEEHEEASGSLIK
ncbi:major facilitator superfamily domain-containing protein [Cokeromyces recurvatus]|uniref:major facilitator superfamily domain-containing protein n=1 Tax=Cokeromyces recurvatus TaxID=90255 RepID=UPI0022207D9A|nr:major facilitator superfamily domain-containing protein [Cokeromyces recurvatus]KAI7907138.1 major facilitator superfamily domain-containing protein [Cokeromyces recurvatus]